MNYLTVKNRFDENLILTNVDGFKGTFSVNDLVPHRTQPDGKIEVKLHNGIQDTWDQRQKLNRLPVHIPVKRAIINSDNLLETDEQARIQYFMNPASDKRIVVFGHTHAPTMVASMNTEGLKCVNVNSGTWIDHNPNSTTIQFVVISRQKADTSSKTLVKFYNFENELANIMAEESLSF
ncbi:hypothetical protein MTYM_01422 [Methylococcales bacterium]|nr:hypothetical protein MTYM_01422 [Methylococcales bacterium]